MSLPEELLKIQKDSLLNDLLADIRKLPVEEQNALWMLFYKEYNDRAIPPLDKILYSEEYLHFGPRDIHKPIYRALQVIDDPSVREIYICAGKGSGKSTLVSVAQIRCLYRVLSYVDPAAYFHLMPGSMLALVNMSVSARQAINVIFHRFKTFLTRLPEFQKVPRKMFMKYKEDASEDYRIKEYFGKERVDVDLYSEVIGAIHFPDKGVIALSGHSRVESFLGYDIFFGSLDEWSRFPQPKERRGGDEVESMSHAEETYHGIVSQAFSRFPDDYKFIGISSPLSKVGDPLYERYLKLKDTGEKIEI